MSRQAANGQAPPSAPADWDAAPPGPAAPLLRCACGGYWTDDDPGRHAHVAVFSHSPRPREPAKPPQEGPDHASS